MELLKKSLLRTRKYALVVIISILLGGFAYYYTHFLLTGMIEKSLIEIAKLGAKTIENNINWKLDTLETISNTEIIRNPSYTVQQKVEFLRELDISGEKVEYAYITTDGILNSVTGNQYDVNSENFFKKAMEGEHIVDAAQHGYSANYSSIAFSVPVKNEDTVIGVLCAVYSSEMLNSLVEDITFGNLGYGYIVDEEGVFIAHKDRSLIINKANVLLSSYGDKNFKKLAEVMIRGQTDAGSYDFNGERKIMGFTKIGNMPWSFAATAPVSDAFRNADPMLAFIITFAFIFILVLICISVYFVYLNRKMKKEEQSLKNAVETAKIIIISFLEDGVVLDFNRNAEEKLGYAYDAVVKTLSIFDFLRPKDRKSLQDIVNDYLKGIKKESFELCLLSNKGESLHMVFNLRVSNPNASTPVFELMGIDITDRVKSEKDLMAKHEELTAVYEELAASEEELKDQLNELIQQKILLQEKDERHNLVVEASNIGIWDWDASTESYFFSDKWYEIFGAGKTEIKGNELEHWKNAIIKEDGEKAESSFKEHLEKKTPYYECEYRVKTDEGIKWIYSVCKALWDDEGKPIKLAGAVTDITAKKETEEKVNRLAYYDTLTGLPNRSKMQEIFDSIKNKTRDKIAVIFIDLDNFKMINDSYGHVIGDKLLIEVSKRLSAVCSANMHISRMGGDEFSVMVSGYKSEQELTSFVESLVSDIEGMVRVNDLNISVSVNIGISLYPKDADNFDDLLKNADTAKYKASEKRCKFAFYDREMNNSIVERLNLRNCLKEAMDKNEFVLYYQPQHRTVDKKIMGFEALVRWKSETLGMVPPSRFIPIAEESGLIIPLGDWILEEAVRFIKNIHKMGFEEMIMSVNISAIQLIQSNFAETVLNLLNIYELAPEKIELEITESVMVESVESFLYNIILLRSAGVRIALDDFGTGYSSLNYLTNIPINTLKIDKSFIDNIGRIKEKSLLIGSIVEIGRRLGLSIVAEGVETEDQYRYLARRHCERIQGYYFSRPMPQQNIIELIKQENQIV